jgi:hypothetical protein
LFYIFNNLRFLKYDVNGNIRSTALNSNPFLTNTWQHVVYTDDGLNTLNSGNIYINGVLPPQSKTQSGNYTNLLDFNKSIRIGLNDYNPRSDHWHRGVMDEIYIYKNRALTAAEVLESYNLGNNGNTLI